MSQDDTTKFKLDLDSKDFIAGVGEAKKSIAELGESNSLVKLAEGFSAAALPIAAIGVALFAVRGAMDIVFDAEKIKRTEAQFNSLAKSAGVYADTLKEGLVTASRGWVTETELMGAANKAMTTLETGVDKLPQLMDAARKQTAIFGGDLVSNFEAMTMAVSTGNTRLLRHLGLIIDQEKAYRDYARSIGATVDVLDQSGKQQAILNAILEKTKGNLGDQNAQVKTATSSWRQIKTDLSELGELFVMVFDKIVGPVLKRFLSVTQELTHGIKNMFVLGFGDEPQKVAVQMEGLHKQLEYYKSLVVDLEKRKLNTGDPVVLAALNKNIAEYKLKIDSATKALHEHETATKKLEDTAKKGTTKKDSGGIDKTKQLEKEAEYKKELIGIDKQIDAIEEKNLQSRIKKNTDLSKTEKLYEQERLLNVKKIEDQIAEVKAKHAAVEAKNKKGLVNDKFLLDHERKTDQQIVKLNEQKNQAMLKSDAELRRRRKADLDNYVADSKNAFDGIGRAASANSDRAAMAMTDFGKNGEFMMNSLTSHVGDGFVKMGEGSEKGADAMRGAMMGMMADIAIHYGEMALAMALVPPNPVYAAAGAALLMLGGYLKGQANKSSSGSGGSISAGGGGSYSSGGGGGGGYAASSNPSDQAAQSAKAQSGTQIVVQGSVFDSDATRIRMAELVRQSSDSTDFSIKRIGGGV